MATAGRYEPGLDGVRALAVVAVLAYHDGRLHGGFLGVSTFFTLSGFLITTLVLRERLDRGRVSLRSFFARRARRLLPAVVLGVLFAAAVTPGLRDANASATFRGDAVAALTDVANWRYVLAGRSYISVFTAPSALLHYWSLAVEVQFYVLLVPLMVACLALGRGRRTTLITTLAMLTAISFAIGVLLAAHGSFDRAYYGTDTRAVEYLVGALCAALLAGRELPRRAARIAAWAGPIALAAAVAAAVHEQLDAAIFRGPLLAYAALSAIIAVAACVRGALRTALSLPPLAWLGRISYGVYVYHWPLYLWISHRRTGLDSFALTAARVAATLAVATVSYYVVEEPVRRGRRVRGRLAWTAVPVCIVAASVAGGAVTATASAPAIHFAPVTPVATNAPYRIHLQPATPAAAVGNATAAPVRRVMVVGDSVALTLGRGIERWGARHGIVVINAAALGCGLLNGAEVRGYWGVEHRNADPCRQFTTWRKLVPQFRPDVVVVLFGAWDVYDASWDGGRTWSMPGSAVWDAHYEPAVERAGAILRADGARVLWLAPPCFADTSPTDVNPPPWFSPARAAAIGTMERRAASRDGDAATDVAHRAGCPVNLTRRPDGVHYADRGADAIAPIIGAQILAAGRR